MAHFRYLNIKTLSFLVLIGIIFTYAYAKALPLITGPVVTIENPYDGAVVSDELITIEGTTKHIATITLNDRAIFIDESGNFSEKLLLAPGYNIMTVNAADKFGRRTQHVIRLMYN